MPSIRQSRASRRETAICVLILVLSFAFPIVADFAGRNW